MVVEKILARVFEDVVRALLQRKNESFVYALVNNRKEEIHDEISKIAQVSLASLFAEGMEGEDKDAMFVAGGSGLEIGRFIRCLFETNLGTKEKLLAYFCGLNEAKKIQFINKLRNASKLDKSTLLIREVLAKCGIILSIAVIPFERRVRGKGRKAPNGK